MLDDLLGKTRLKERISALEEEVDRLEKKLEAESRRRADAVTEKQEAERQINKLESKIDELRGRLEMEEETKEQDFRRVIELGANRVEGVLELLESIDVGGEDLTSTYIEPGGSLNLELDPGDEALLRRIDSVTGKVIFMDDTGLIQCCLVPPLPIKNTYVKHDGSFHVDRSYFSPGGVHAVAVVRSDTFAAGIYSNGLDRFSRVSSGVQGKHSKGGFSQSRFERRREQQIDEHVEESVSEFEDLLEGWEPELVAVVGEESVVNRFTGSVRVDVAKAVDARGEGRELLEEAYGKLWSSRLYVF